MLNVDDANARNNHAFPFALFASVQSMGNTIGRLGTTVREGMSTVLRSQQGPIRNPALPARSPQSWFIAEARRSVGGARVRKLEWAVTAYRREVDRNDAKVKHGLAAEVEPMRSLAHTHTIAAQDCRLLAEDDAPRRRTSVPVTSIRVPVGRGQINRHRHEALCRKSSSQEPSHRP